jgi:glycosyltransferase involved in cell wall biosynthesis
MALHKPQIADMAHPVPGGSLAVLPPGRERLAIVSTRNKLCGIAAYTAALERQLGDLFELTVFDLDQYLLRSRHSSVRKAADEHIKEICRSLARFDTVNLQLEFGTLGHAAKDIYRRFSWLIEAAPRISVTFHTQYRPPIFPRMELLNAVTIADWRKAGELYSRFRRDRLLSVGIATQLQRLARRKPVSVIVHNHRDRADAHHLYRFDRIYDHPLSFLSPSEAETVTSTANRQRFPTLEALPGDAKLVGVFGFLNDYKGFGTVVRALHHLAENYHLLIFGSVHPNEIPARSAIHPYVASLLDEAHVDASLYDQMTRGTSKLGLNIDVERHLGDLFGRHPRDLSRRIHFVGALDDADFLAGMAICDAVVLPYLEVGQSSSGPISQAVELGCRVIASRTHTFLEFARYHPETIEFFDIGNHLELAERIAARRQYAERRELPRYTVETNKAIYLAANSAPQGETGGSWRGRFISAAATKPRERAAPAQ